MNFYVQFLGGKYEIIDFNKINAKKDSFTARWDGFYHDSDRKADPDRDEKALGFFTVSKKKKKKSKTKIYLDNGDGTFSEESDILLASYKHETWGYSDRKGIGSEKKGQVSMQFGYYTTMNRKGKTEKSKVYTVDIYNRNHFLNSEIEPQLGSDLFSDYIPDPCAIVEF